MILAAGRRDTQGMERSATVYKDRNQEIREAISAGEYALSCLYDARSKLNSASTWGIIDIFGGGLISTFLKHSRIDEARNSMTQARNALQSFSKELRDVDSMQPGFDVDGFLSFADFFFDGVLVDVLVQSRISKAKTQVDDAIRRVEDMIRTLKAYT